jgi:hypothetical protein
LTFGPKELVYENKLTSQSELLNLICVKFENVFFVVSFFIVSKPKQILRRRLGEQPGALQPAVHWH